jgi:hypothetical protein
MYEVTWAYEYDGEHFKALVESGKLKDFLARKSFWGHLIIEVIKLNGA